MENSAFFVEIFNNFSYSLALLRALGVRFMPILCLVAKNRRRKDTKGLCPLEPRDAS